MREHVLVTGGAGYVGSILCEHLLARGHRVTVIDNLQHGLQDTLFSLCHHPSFDFVLGDARDESLVREHLGRANAIIPLAAVVGAKACDRDPWTARSVNLGAVQMLNRLRSKDQLVVFPNTNSGYGTKSGEITCTEESPLEPISLYGQTKVDAENELLSTESATCLRLATVFGVSPRMRTDLLVNHFVLAAVRDRYLVIFEKDFKRNYVHVRDVADCFVHCLERDEDMTGRTYNLGLDDANLSKEQLALAVKAQVPDLHLHFAEIGEDPDKRNYIVSNRRLAEAGFVARRDIPAGITELLKGYRMIHRPSFANA
ncbi:MAG: NAD(P)-dependent oxidoreductase [Acidobacteriota bacterium]